MSDVKVFTPGPPRGVSGGQLLLVEERAQLNGLRNHQPSASQLPKFPTQPQVQGWLEPVHWPEVRGKGDLSVLLLSSRQR